MTRKNLCLLIAAALALILVIACGGKNDAPQTAPRPVGDGGKGIAGTWTNPAYDNEGRSGRVVYTANHDGSFNYTAFDKSDGSGNAYSGKVVYLKTWTDPKGNRYGKSKLTLEYGMSWETLDRISPDGKTLEVQSGVEEINPQGPRYSIYYRK